MRRSQALALAGAGAAAAGAGYLYWRLRKAEEARRQAEALRQQQEAIQQLAGQIGPPGPQPTPTLGQIGQQIAQGVGQSLADRISQWLGGLFKTGYPVEAAYAARYVTAYAASASPWHAYGAAAAVEWYMTGAPVVLTTREEVEGFESGAIPLLAAAGSALTGAIGTFLTKFGPTLGIGQLVSNCLQPWGPTRAYREKLAQANASLGGQIPAVQSRPKPQGARTQTQTVSATATQVGTPAMAALVLPFDQEVRVQYRVVGTASRCGQQLGLVKILGSPGGRTVKEFFSREAEGVAKLFRPETHSDSQEVRLKLPAGSYILQAAKTDSAEASITVTYEDLPAAAVGRLALPTSLRRALPIALGVAGVAGLGVVAYRYARRRMG